MQFNHYGGQAAALAVDLINYPAAFCRTDVLKDALARRGVEKIDVEIADLAPLQRWAIELDRCFGQMSLSDRQKIVNELLTRAAGRPYIATHDGHPHLHYGSMQDGIVSGVRAITITGLAYVVCFAGFDRLGRCARNGCESVYVDTSRRGTREYCSSRCGNTVAVARHRKRADHRVLTEDHRTATST